MKNGKRKVIAQIAGPGLVLAALLALMLSNTGMGRAQSTTASAAPAATRPQATAAAPASPGHQPAAKGQNEGIHVHGHWTIEVRNPDGKLVSHTEFENALQTNGQQALAALLSGFTPGDWEVALDGASGDTQLPCTSPTTGGLSPCLIAAPGSNFAGNCSGNLPTLALAQAQCFSTLAVGNDVSLNATNLTLGGTLTASAASVITDVQTFMNLCSRSITPSVCAGAGGPTLGAFEFTAATLPAQGSGLCGGANQPSCAVNVSAGQTVSVSVAISFQ